MEGVFIAIEGPDGSGKSTIINLIEEYFKRENLDYIITREPGGTRIGEAVRNIILENSYKEMTSKTESLLYAASRSQHVEEKIRPALEAGKIVVSDRFVFSSLAYQGVGRDLGIESVKSINDFAIGSTYPDLILFFDVDPKVTLERKLGEGGDRLELEGSNFHEKVYGGYLDVIEKYPTNVKVIDASQEIDRVYNESIKYIKKLLGR